MGCAGLSKKSAPIWMRSLFLYNNGWEFFIIRHLAIRLAHRRLPNHH
jgi:hypothetical protein